MIRPIIRLVALIWLATSVSAFSLSAYARAGTFSVWACGTWTVHAGVMHPIVGPGYGAGAVADCAKTGLALVTTGKERSGNQAAWQATAPRGIALTGAWVPPFDLSASGINDGNGEGGGFYWKGGNQPVNKRTTTWKSHRFASPYFGWHIVCRQAYLLREGTLRQPARIPSTTQSRGEPSSGSVDCGRDESVDAACLGPRRMAHFIPSNGSFWSVQNAGVGR